VCDSCKIEHSDDYKLIAKTDAKSEFLLKDCDFDFRDPPLKYMVKKNPHSSYGEMKLYLRIQCQERAMLVHQDLEKLEEKKEIKLLNLHKTRQKNYEKKLSSNILLF
jgi:DNA-repair protein complementing XP-A cells